MRVILALIFAIVYHCGFCDDANHLSVYLFNDSNTSLTFERATENIHSQHYRVTPQTLPSERVGLISITSSRNEDVIGTLHFLDNHHQDNKLFIMDFRKMRMGQFVLALTSSKLSATVTETHNNPSKDPKALMIDSAKIHIRNTTPTP